MTMSKADRARTIEILEGILETLNRIATPPSIVLSREEIELLTGYEQGKRQADQLRAWGLPYYMRHDGVPMVVRAQLGARIDREATTAGPNLTGPGFRRNGEGVAPADANGA